MMVKTGLCPKWGNTSLFSVEIGYSHRFSFSSRLRWGGPFEKGLSPSGRQIKSAAIFLRHSSRRGAPQELEVSPGGNRLRSSTHAFHFQPRPGRCMKPSAAIGEVPWHGTGFAIPVRHPVRRNHLAQASAGLLLRRSPGHRLSLDPFPGVLFCQNLAFPLPPDQFNIDFLLSENRNSFSRAFREHPLPACPAIIDHGDIR